MGPTTTDEQLEKWGEEYAEWSKENNHLPNLTDSSAILDRLKKQVEIRKQQESPENRIKIIEQKLAKLMNQLNYHQEKEEYEECAEIKKEIDIINDKLSKL